MRPLCLLTWPAVAAVAAVAQLLAVAAGTRADPGGYLFGDSGLYAAAAASLVRDADLDLLNQCYPDCPTLAAALPELDGDHAGEFGLSHAGTLTLKQSPVFAAAAVPFYLVLGKPGFLAFNLVVLNALLVGVAKLGGGPAGRAAGLVLLLGTPVIRFAFNYSPDLFLTALVVGALLAVKAGRPGACGVLLGLAVGGKIYVAALAVPVALAAVAGCRPRGRAVLLGLAGGVIGLSPAAGFNAWQYGAPWVTGYERQLKVEAGVVALADHSSRFTEPPLTGLRNLLFDPAVGLAPTAPLWLLSVPAAGWLLARRGAPAWPAGAVGVAGANFAVFACYDGWHGGAAAGNRYLFPALAAGFAVAGAAVTTWQAGRAGCAAGCGRSGPAAEKVGD